MTMTMTMMRTSRGFFEAVGDAFDHRAVVDDPVIVVVVVIVFQEVKNRRDSNRSQFVRVFLVFKKHFGRLTETEAGGTSVASASDSASANAAVPASAAPLQCGTLLCTP